MLIVTLNKFMKWRKYLSALVLSDFFLYWGYMSLNRKSGGKPALDKGLHTKDLGLSWSAAL